MDPFAIQQPAEDDFRRRISPGIIAPLLSSVIWGSGQLYNGESRKAAIFLTGQLVAFLYLWDYYNQYLVYQVMVSHLGNFLYSFIIFLFSFGVFFVWLYNLFDARRVASFLDFISAKSPTVEELEEIQGWDFEVDHNKRDRGIPWGPAFVYVVSVLVLVKYVFSPSQSELELLVRKVQERPAGVPQRLELAAYYAQNGKSRHAVVEIEEFLNAYGNTLNFEEKQLLNKFLRDHRASMKESSFVTEKVLEQEDAADWVGLNQSLSWEEFEQKAVKFLSKNGDDAVLVPLLVQGYIERMEWDRVRDVVSRSMRSRPHDPFLIQNLGRAEDELRRIKENSQKLGLQKKAFSEAVSMYQQDQFTESSEALERYFQLGGDSKEAYLLANANLIRSGRYAEAVKLLRDAIRMYPEDGMLRYFLGKAHFGKRDFQEAVDNFLLAAESKTDDPEIFKNLAIGFKKLGKYAEAIDWYERALNLKKDDPALLFLLGYAQLKNKSSKEALDTYKKLTRLYPNYPELDYYRALAEEQNGLLIGARESLVQVKSTSPFYEQAKQKIEYLTERISKIGKAKVGSSGGISVQAQPLEEVATVVQVPSEKPNTVSRIDIIANLLRDAETYFQQDRWSEARNAYMELLKVDDNHFHSLKQIGKIYLEREGDYIASRKYLSKAIELRPNDIWLNVAMGIIEKAGNDVERSIYYFKQAIAKDPSHLNANFNLALLLEDQNRMEEAKAAYKTVLINHPNHQLSYNYLGDIYYNEGEYSLAASMYSAFLKLAPDNVGIGFKLALCQERSADYKSALETLNSLAESVRGEVVMEEEVLAAIRRVEAKL